MRLIKRAPYLMLIVFLMVLCACGGNYSINYVASSGGKIQGETSQVIEEGVPSSVVVAIPDEGYRFIGWSDGDTNASRCDIATEDRIFEAKFEKISSFSLVYKADEGGKIEGLANQTVEENKNGTEVKAIANEGFIFVSWSDGVINTARTDLALENIEVTAVFKRVNFVVEYITPFGVIGNEKQLLGLNENGSEVTALTSEGYRFMGWSDGVKTLNRQDTNIVNDIKVTALFEKEYRLEVSVDTISQNWGIVEGQLSQKLIKEEESQTLLATPSFGYKFKCWSNGDTNPEIKVSINENTNLIAYFDFDLLDFPALWINTNDYAPITSKENYLQASTGLVNSDGIVFDSLPASIRGRGNSSWYLANKKSYRLKFDSKIDLFGNGSAKSWTLIANYFDKTFLRNYLAYDLSRNMDGIEYTTSTVFVDLYLNNKYQGVYLLCEQIEVNKNRVMDTKEDETGEVDVPYLLELDERIKNSGTEGVDYFLLSNKVAYAIKSPESDNKSFNTKQAEYIKAYTQSCFDSIRKGTFEEVCSLIDIDSFVDVYIVNEFFKSKDCGYSSFYLYKKPSGKLYAGPVWDFDISSGNVQDYSSSLSSTGLYVTSANMWYAYLSKRAEFNELVGKRLEEKEDLLEELVAKIPELAKKYQADFNRNFIVWDILDQELFEDSLTVSSFTDYDSQLNYLIEWLEERLDWLLEYYD